MPDETRADAIHEPLPPTTTAAQDLTAKGQRGINLIWEQTQSYISLSVVGTTCGGVIVSVIGRFFAPQLAVTFPAEWWTIVGLVIGFYFGRTNHTRTGGVGDRGEEHR